jgi:hypothetical protein
MSIKTKKKLGPSKKVKLLFCLSIVFLLVLPCSVLTQSTTSRNRIRQALVVRRQRPLVAVDTSTANTSNENSSTSNSPNESLSHSDQEKDQEKLIADENEERQSQSNGRTLKDFTVYQIGLGCAD